MLVNFKIEKGVIIIDEEQVFKDMEDFFTVRREKSGLTYVADEMDKKMWLERAQYEVALLKFFYKEGKCFTRLGEIIPDGYYTCKEGYLRS